MHVLLAVLLLAHGIAHLPGLLVSWQVRTFAELPYRTTILGGALDIGDRGIRAAGLVWLALGLLFIVAAGGTLMRTAWWQPLVYAAAGLSAALCLLGWPEARLGLVANGVIVLLVVIFVRAGWL